MSDEDQRVTVHDIPSSYPPALATIRALAPVERKPTGARLAAVVFALHFAARIVRAWRRFKASLAFAWWRARGWGWRCELCGGRPRASRLFCRTCVDAGMR